MQPNFKTEQILKNDVIILTFLLKLKGFFNFFCICKCLWNLMEPFLVKQINSFQEYVKKITKMPKKIIFLLIS